MVQQTDRLALPLLAAAQAQKEVTHNEALVLVDALVQPVVVAIAPAVVPANPVPGQCWIVGSGASGAWAGQDGALAAWTAGGWRFVAAFEGMAVWSIADAVTARRAGGIWLVGALTGNSLTLGGNQVVGARAAAIATPTGGSTVDAQARAVLATVLTTMRSHGLIAS